MKEWDDREKERDMRIYALGSIMWEMYKFIMPKLRERLDDEEREKLK